MKNRRVLSLVISASVVLAAVMTGCQQGGGNASGQSQSQAGIAPITAAAQSSQAYQSAAQDDMNSGVVSSGANAQPGSAGSNQGQGGQASVTGVSSGRQVIYNQKPVIGSTVKFGAYEQDNNLSNGPEPIEWIVIDKFDTGDYCLMSVYGLDQVDYDTKDKVTAKDSHIYEWMNNDFYNEAFNEEERAFMGTVKYLARASGSSEYKTLIDTKVALLAPNQLKQYLKDDNARKAKATEYAKARGAEVQGGQCWYWLCPTADLNNGVLYDTHAAAVNYDGSVMEKISTNKSTGGAVRPVIVVFLDNMVQ